MPNALDAALLKKVFPKAKQTVLDAFVSQAPTVLPEFGISSAANRLHFFLAQIGHESGGLTVLEENLSYSADRILVVFKKRVPDRATAESLARNPEALGNHVYGNRKDLGNDQPGDGFKYRGRGFIQLTGKAMYRTIGEACGLDLMAHPELASDPNNCLRVACGFWKLKKLNPLSDQDLFTDVTRRINGGTNGLEDRRNLLAKARMNIPFPLGFGQPGPAPAVPDAVVAAGGADDEIVGSVIFADGRPERWLVVNGYRRLLNPTDIPELRNNKLITPSDIKLSGPVLDSIPVMPGAVRDLGGTKSLGRPGKAAARLADQQAQYLANSVTYLRFYVNGLKKGPHKTSMTKTLKKLEAEAAELAE